MIHAFVSANQSIDGFLGQSASDTMSIEDSQQGAATGANTQTIDGIVHASICPLGCSDIAETSYSSVWSQAAWWLLGGSASGLSQSESSAAMRTRALRGSRALDASSGSPAPLLDLTGYTQVDASNVSFSPASSSTLTVNSATSITAASPTKTITEILLFQSVSDPTDVPLLYSTESPFVITFAPTRLGSTNFAAFAVFSDNTFAATLLNYAFQPSGGPLALSLVNAPVASLPVGATAIVGAQALFSNGPVNVSQAATYTVRSGATNVFSVDSTGTVTANGPGNDWLDVSYNGVTASARIAVGTCTYSLSPVTQIVEYSGGSVSIQVTTQDGCVWTADDGASVWLTFTNASGSGSGTITLNASANTSGNQQTAIVTVANRDVAVTQPASACSYVLNATTATLPAGGGSNSDGVTTSCPIGPVSGASWLNAAAGSNAIVFSASANTTGASRSATITLDTQQLEVTQASLAGTNTTIAVGPNPAAAGQTVTLSAAVSAQVSGSDTPTGLVIFFDGSTPLGNAALNGTGLAALALSTLTQGSHSITASYSGDANFSPSASQAVTEVVNASGCGTTPPVTTATVSGPAGNNGWYLGPVSVTLSATDASSTVSQTLFTLDGGTQATYTGPFTVSGDAIHQLSFYSIDACGNQEKTNLLTIKIDDAPPVTTVALSGTAGSNGWFTGPVLVTFSATDNLSGVASTTFSTNGGTAWTVGTSITLTANVIYTVLFHSTDVAGNVEAPKSIQVQIDQTPPTIACSLNPLPNANGWNSTPVTVSFAASDPISGIASVSPPVTLTGQGAKQSVTGVAADNAGNTASISCVVNIDLTPPEAYLEFDPTTKDLAVYGTDALSGVAPGPVAPTSVVPAPVDGGEQGIAHLRTYQIFDLAGNSLLLTVKVWELADLVGWRISSLQYQSNAALAPSANQTLLGYLYTRAGVLKSLSQEMSVGSGKATVLVLAQYDSEKNETVIIVTGNGAQKPVTKSGLDLLRLSTEAGKLVIQY